MDRNEITGSIVNAAMEVHSALGPGLLEEPYKRALAHELKIRGFSVQAEHSLPVTYKGTNIELGYRLDLIVEDQIIVELKSVREIAAIHKAQLLTYLKMSKYRIGLLMNFNSLRLKDGIVRLAN